MNKQYSILVALLFSLSLLAGCGDYPVPPGGGKPPGGGVPPKEFQPVMEVTDVSLAVLESLPEQLQIHALGNVPSSGWTDAKLVQYVYIQPPPDGIYDFGFVARPPAEPSLPVITPIETTFRLAAIPSNLKGVRIHAANNQMEAWLVPDPAAAYFEFVDVGKETFVIKLTDSMLITHARGLVSGQITEQPHVMGTIVKQKAPYNAMWSYHLEPDSISFFDFAVEVCDSTMAFVEAHLDEVGGAFLPGNQWCPWSSKLVGEVKFTQ